MIETETLVVEHLRAIRVDLAELKTEMIEVKTRLGHVEGLYASLSGRVDRAVADIQLIKCRLDLIDA